MSFYKRRTPAMGFAWIAPVVQLVGGALQSHPVEGASIPPPPQTNPAVTAAVVLGGLGLVSGLVYFAWKRA